MNADPRKFSHAQSNWSRRDFLRRSAGLAALAASGALPPAALAAPKPKKNLPNPNKSGIEHVVVAMMENRSFDHLLGWLPGADGQQGGLSYADNAGIFHPTTAWPDFQGCGHPDPDHSYEGARVEY